MPGGDTWEELLSLTPASIPLLVTHYKTCHACAFLYTGKGYYPRWDKDRSDLWEEEENFPLHTCGSTAHAWAGSDRLGQAGRQHGRRGRAGRQWGRGGRRRRGGKTIPPV